MLAEALEAEVEGFLSEFQEQRTGGEARLVRNGYLPQREVQTGIGGLPVQVPRVRDRETGSESLRFTSKVVPPYLRRAKSIEELLPWLYLRGISTEGLLRCLGGPARSRGSGTLGRDGHTAQVPVGARTGGLESTEPRWKELCLLSGRMGSIATRGKRTPGCASLSSSERHRKGKRS